MTAERHAGAPPRWHDRFSPTWWAAWTFALARPAETDACRLHDGRCSGACETTTETEE